MRKFIVISAFLAMFFVAVNVFLPRVLGQTGFTDEEKYNMTHYYKVYKGEDRASKIWLPRGWKDIILLSSPADLKKLYPDALETPSEIKDCRIFIMDRSQKTKMPIITCFFLKDKLVKFIANYDNYSDIELNDLLLATEKKFGEPDERINATVQDADIWRDKNTEYTQGCANGRSFSFIATYKDRELIKIYEKMVEDFEKQQPAREEQLKIQKEEERKRLQQERVEKAKDNL